MKINRSAQLEILNFLAKEHPNAPRKIDQKITDAFGIECVISNCCYLEGHGLIYNGFKLNRNMKSDQWIQRDPFLITPKGIDFLMDDGGLSAILNVVKVRLDSITIKQLIEFRLEQAKDISPHDKSLAKKALQKLQDRGLEKLVDTLLQTGLQAIPSTSSLIDMLQDLSY